ncbi:MAG: ABC transporter permease [Deltaproteobacteria bacterium]|jgi:peptide/nickel transport system permease protein|nr:ABC transporter permease [Deltaproteobacteria bacterium]
MDQNNRLNDPPAPAAQGRFEMVGPAYREYRPALRKKTWLGWLRGKPILAVTIFLLILLGCVFSRFIVNHDPSQFYLSNLNQAPNGEFYFGTDSMGRDIYSIIWQGGRSSLIIGFLSTFILTIIGVFYGCVSGSTDTVGDDVMMRGVEFIQSIPTLLMILLIISLMSTQNVISISFVIGITAWFALARIVRSEVKQIRNSEYVLASRCMGSSFAYRARKHLIPNFVSAIMFVVISSVATNIGMESTLSFLGLGLPVEVLSWGSMLALADRALLLNTWWVIVIPGGFLVVTLLCVTQIGHYFRQQTNRRPSNI